MRRRRISRIWEALAQSSFRCASTNGSHIYLDLHIWSGAIFKMQEQSHIPDLVQCLTSMLDGLLCRSSPEAQTLEEC